MKKFNFWQARKYLLNNPKAKFKSPYGQLYLQIDLNNDLFFTPIKKKLKDRSYSFYNSDLNAIYYLVED